MIAGHWKKSFVTIAVFTIQFLFFFFCWKALEVIGMLKKVMPIERAQMRLKITSSKEGKKLKEKLSKIGAKVETEEWDGSTVILVSNLFSFWFFYQGYISRNKFIWID